MHVYRRARVPVACLPTGFTATDPLEPWCEVDITIDDRRIVGVSPTAAADNATDFGGALVFPGFVDVHTHLDKAHTWTRSPNPRGEFADALAILRADSARWSEDDLHRRANFALRRAWSHGTVALRTHLDTRAEGPGENAHAVLARLRAVWAGRITIQTVSLCDAAAFSAGEATRVVELTARHRADALGGFVVAGPRLARELDSLFAAARELGVGLDLHVDENGDAASECLRAVAEAVLRHAFPHPVVCGHACSLAVQAPERQRETIALVKTAGVHVVTLPLCNLYLQDRRRAALSEGGHALTPHRRGVTLVHELLEAGVNVAAASDNVRDAFFPWGDLDAAEVFSQTVRLAHLDTRLAAAPALVTTAPAAIMGLADTGRVSPGARADLVMFAARTFNELFALPGGARRLIHGEAFRVAEPPPYSELE